MTFINRDKLIEFLRSVGKSHLVFNEIESFPASDVVEVIRCKDCYRSFRDAHGERYCNILVSRWNTTGNPRYVNDYDYCSWAVRVVNDG